MYKRLLCWNNVLRTDIGPSLNDTILDTQINLWLVEQAHSEALNKGELTFEKDIHVGTSVMIAARQTQQINSSAQVCKLIQDHGSCQQIIQNKAFGRCGCNDFWVILRRKITFDMAAKTKRSHLINQAGQHTPSTQQYCLSVLCLHFSWCVSEMFVNLERWKLLVQCKNKVCFFFFFLNAVSEFSVMKYFKYISSPNPVKTGSL